MDVVERRTLFLQRARKLLRDGVDEARNLLERVKPRDREAYPGVAHGHGRKDRQIGIEASLEKPVNDVVADLRQTDADEEERRALLGQERERVLTDLVAAGAESLSPRLSASA